MLGMDVDVVVPGHGPLTDKAGVTAVRDYLAFVDARGDGPPRRRARRVRRGAGDRRGSSTPATTSASWGEAGRIAVNVETVYRTLDPDPPAARRRRAVPPDGRARARLNGGPRPRRRRGRRRPGGPGARRGVSPSRAGDGRRRARIAVDGDVRHWRDDVPDLPDTLLRPHRAAGRRPRSPPPRHRAGVRHRRQRGPPGSPRRRRRRPRGACERIQPLRRGAAAC